MDTYEFGDIDFDNLSSFYTLDDDGESNMIETINIEKQKLIATLTENLGIHKELYTSALLAWKQNYEKELGRHLKEVKKGEFADVLRLPSKPRSYAKEYDTALKQLEFSSDDVIPLDERNFKQYVLDEWSFDSHFYSPFTTPTSFQATTLSAAALQKISVKNSLD